MAEPDIFFSSLRVFAANMQPGVAGAEQVRRDRLRDLLRHVTTRVPLYRDLYAAHKIDIEKIKTSDDLWQLPHVSKADYLRVGPDGYTDCGEDALNLYSQTTSGSVGRALTMYAQPKEAARMMANVWSGWVSAGVTTKDRLMMMSAPYLAEEVGHFSKVFIPVQTPVDQLIETFRTFQPTVIIGMVEAIALLSVELARREIPERRAVRLLFPFGQTYSHQLRSMVQRGFDAKVFTLYGSAEAGWLGYECEEHCGWHVPEGRVIVQIARTGRPNEPAAPNEIGELILTSLLRATTPFIRYRLFDAAALDPTPCRCGRNSARIVNLEGRIQDFLVATDGHLVGPGAIAIDLTLHRPVIIDHRIVQEDRRRVRVSLVLDPNLPPVPPREVVDLVRRHLGHDVEVNVEVVDQIPREASGKRRRVFRMFDLPSV
jgi:phenylacetate-CoA ligase